MREIVFDTETTGLDPAEGHRVVEIGCVELVNRIPTGQTFHAYLNPDREVPRAAYEIHGLGADFLKTQPRFPDIVEEFLSFVREAVLVAHNAPFDVRFINAELAMIGVDPLNGDSIVDTLALARRKCPGPQHTLDALCRRFGIDNSSRTTHGALLDSELLAEVYLELCGGRQAMFDLAVNAGTGPAKRARRIEPPRPHNPSDAEITAHRDFLQSIPDAIWTTE